MSGKWISCEERLPGLRDDRLDGHFVSDPVLITYLGAYDGQPHTATKTAVRRDDGIWFWGDLENPLEGRVMVEVIAWQPRPEPYRKGSGQGPLIHIGDKEQEDGLRVGDRVKVMREIERRWVDGHVQHLFPAGTIGTIVQIMDTEPPNIVVAADGIHHCYSAYCLLPAENAEEIQ